MTFTAGLRVEEPRLRIAEPDALTALRAVNGQPAIAARARLRFGPGRTCEPLARLLDRAIVRAEAAGLDPASLIVADGSAAAAETSSGCAAGRTAPPAGSPAPPVMCGSCCARPDCTRRPSRTCPRTRPRARRRPGRPPPPARPPPRRAVSWTGRRSRGAVRRHRPRPGREHRRPRFRPRRRHRGPDRRHHHDPHVRGLPADSRHGKPDPHRPRRAHDCVEDFRVDWQWLPAWRPADITDSGREQLSAIGFSF